ncbi:DNA polymerase epsilon catalytic subunit A [Coccidioides immitis RMSCC 3703]|uniref:DNA polymerase epsilon catalytic subunit n=1 Tax=Coccidioides immitis RMSCC 3703 TaxID=454286 RepID=A0A0J8TYN7_COCIT|nr:DNA polymerase epsilon catalytic subunit A [Coccidioides immitis RMSCC 3703]
MTKTLEEYGSQKSTSITTARRLAEFLGDQMVKDKGLNCKYIISAAPKGSSITERAVPVAIFSAEPNVKRFFLRRWLKEDPGDMDPRSIIDWEYYLERLGSVIQKLITIPAALQKVRNPVPRVPHPDWLQRRIDIKDDKFKQKKMTDLFDKTPLSSVSTNIMDHRLPTAGDIEDAMSTQKLKTQISTQMSQKRKAPESSQSTDPFANIPGEIRAFVLIDRKVHAITVKVPRQLFINFRDDQLPDVDIEGCTVQKVNHALPNGHPSVHLFQLTMPEFTYVKDVATISALLDHPSVEGVYESKVPLDIRTVLKLGTLCTFDESQRGVLGKGLEHGFELSTLLKAAPTQTYLADSQFEFVFVYHIVSGDRQIFSVFSTRRDEAHIVIFSKQRDGQGFPNVDKIYANSLRRRIEEGNNENWQQVFEYQHALHFRTMQVTAKRKAHLEVGDLLRKFRNESSYPTLVVLQSPHKQQLLHEVSAFKDFPVLSLRSDPSDNELPRLGWQPFVAKQIVMHYLALDSWINHLIEFARYGDIPLCNLERDDPKFLIDIAYARRLEQNNVVLWWSPNPLPDHAGYEKDNINSLIQKVDMPTINNPGAYSSVCIDLDVRNLAINTILTSSLINDLEGSESVLLNPSAPTGQEVSDGTGVLYSDTAFSSAGIVVLRDMVKAWWAEACQGKVMADVMVQHLIRWVESPDCNLYDRALHQYVQMMSKKALQQLMGDFRRVGSSVIFASPNRLLLQTTKTEVGNAYAYSQYILKSIKSKPLFNFLDLEIKEYWEYLLWYDEFNYGGKACHEVVESNSQELETIMHWQMAGFLPSPLQPVFNDWVVEYIEIMHGLKKSNKSLDSDESRPTQIQFKSMAETEGIDVTNVLSESYSKALKRQIVGLIRRQRDEMLHPELVSDYDFPALPGAFWHDTKRERNPTLELVKYLTHVLSLSKHTSLEVRILRRELLALFDIKEFSDAGKFENPSASLKLPQLICNHCTMSRDLDLCRDGDLLPEEGGSAASKAWCCLYCGTEYDRLALEERMISEVQGIVVEWQTQDLKCEKCGGLMVNPLMEHCSCGGRWTTMLDRRAAERKVRIFKSVAEFYGLKMLTIVTNGVLDGL